MLTRLSEWCYTRRRLVLVLWVVALVGAIAVSGAVGGTFRADYFAPGSESKAALDLLQETFPEKAGDTVQVVVRAPAGVRSPDVRQRVEALLADLARAEHVTGVVSPYGPRGAHQISRDGTIAYAELELD